MYQISYYLKKILYIKFGSVQVSLLWQMWPFCSRYASILSYDHIFKLFNFKPLTIQGSLKIGVYQERNIAIKYEAPKIRVKL